MLVIMVRLCLAQSAPPPLPPPLPAGVEIRVQAQPQKATVGDPIRISLDITLPKGFQATLPKLGNQLGDFAILEYYPGPSIPAPAGSPSSPSAGPAPRDGAPVHHQAQIVAALYRTGEFEFPPVQITLRTPDGKEINATSQAVIIQIQSVLNDKEPQLKALKRQAEIQEPVRWLLWLSLAFLLLIIASLAWWMYQRRKRTSFQLPAHAQIDPLVLAEADLRDLIRRGLLESGFVKQFYVLLADIVKRIVEAGYAIQTVEKTTSEIMEELHLNSAAYQAAKDLQRIESVLFECDLVKFAKYVPSKSENNTAVGNAFLILDSVKKLRSAPPVTAQPAVAGAP